jgi:flavin reductase (DIM6/NTAB) family NADH-FMN oxidoreductase RutF
MTLVDSDPQLQFRQAISRFATGVTVVTTNTDAGPAGMTASAFSSLSLEPLLLLVCISNRLPTHAALEQSRRFAVNVLGEEDDWVARRFATPNPNKFAGLDVTHEAGVPVLHRAIAHFVCDVHERIAGGDHSIFIGAVRECSHDDQRRPLLYFGSAFCAMRDLYTQIHGGYGWDASLAI